MSPGPDPKLTVGQVVEIMDNSNRPFWSVKQFADQADVTRPTARTPLEEAEENDKIAVLEVAGCPVYYLPGKEMKRVGEGDDPIQADLRGYWNDYFVGNQHAPSVVSMGQTELTASDQARFFVMGRPGDWDYYEIATIDEPIDFIEPSGGEWYSAIITGELYAKPTVPIEHIEYPDDYELELNIGGEYSENGNLVAAGVKNHLIKPCDNALFLQDVTVEKLEGPGPSMNDVETVHAPSQREKYTATKLLEQGKRQDSSEEYQ